MGSFGVLDSGFARKTLTDALGEITQSERDAFGADINTLPSSVLGQINGIFAAQIDELWNALQATYAAQYPATAAGRSLDDLAALTGVTRLTATSSTVRLLLFLQPAVTVPAGSIVRIGATGAQFATQSAVTNSGGTAAPVAAVGIAVQTGPVQATYGTLSTIGSPVFGWQMRSVAESGRGEPFTDITTSVNDQLRVAVNGGPYQLFTLPAGPISAASAAASINGAAPNGFTAYDVGSRLALVCNSTGQSIQVDLTSSANSVFQFPSGVSLGANPADASIGRNVETDPELRLRRDQLLRIGGARNAEAIRAAVLTVTGVNQAFVIENNTLLTADGIPPKAFETIVDDDGAADDDAIAEAIFGEKCAGIEAFGTSVTVVVTDAQGFDQNISFTRPTLVSIDSVARIAMDPDVLAQYSTQALAAEAVKNAIRAYINGLGIGDDVIYERAKCSVFDVSGVTDFQGTAPTFTLNAGTTNIVIATREKARAGTVLVGINGSTPI